MIYHLRFTPPIVPLRGGPGAKSRCVVAYSRELPLRGAGVILYNASNVSTWVKNKFAVINVMPNQLFVNQRTQVWVCMKQTKYTKTNGIQPFLHIQIDVYAALMGSRMIQISGVSQCNMNFLSIREPQFWFAWYKQNTLRPMEYNHSCIYKLTFTQLLCHQGWFRFQVFRNARSTFCQSENPNVGLREANKIH